MTKSKITFEGKYVLVTMAHTHAFTDPQGISRSAIWGYLSAVTVDLTGTDPGDNSKHFEGPQTMLRIGKGEGSIFIHPYQIGTIVQQSKPPRNDRNAIYMADTDEGESVRDIVNRVSIYLNGKNAAGLPSVSYSGEVNQLKVADVGFPILAMMLQIPTPDATDLSPFTDIAKDVDVLEGFRTNSQLAGDYVEDDLPYYVLFGIGVALAKAHPQVNTAITVISALFEQYRNSMY